MEQQQRHVAPPLPKPLIAKEPQVDHQLPKILQQQRRQQQQQQSEIEMTSTSPPQATLDLKLPERQQRAQGGGALTAAALNLSLGPI